LLYQKLQHTRSKSLSASRHYEVLNFRLVGHAATLHVEPDLRLKPAQVRSRRSQPTLLHPTLPAQFHLTWKFSCEFSFSDVNAGVVNGNFLNALVVRPFGHRLD
jgi:hypothetical protein